MSQAPGMGSHHSPKMQSEVWLTPPEILKALGPFDLDPCAAPEPRPWPTARAHIGEADDGLSWDWMGRVWCNPPYGREVTAWMKRLADHGWGTALIFARTETDCWMQEIWPRASAILFLAGRLHFHHPSGERASNNSGAPSALVAYGEEDMHALMDSGLEGALVTEWHAA